MHMISQLVSSGSILVNIEKWGSLELSEKGESVLFKKEIFLCKKFRDDRTLSNKHSPDKGVKKNVSATFSDFEPDVDLMMKLKELRLKIAREENVPAFVIFSDRTLREMSQKKPKNEADFLRISGVGTVKLEKYGEKFLDCVLNN